MRKKSACVFAFHVGKIQRVCYTFPIFKIFLNTFFRSQVTKKIDIVKLPPVLIIQLGKNQIHMLLYLLDLLKGKFLPTN
jgi:hypothetical protein